MSAKDKWIRRFSVDETAKHKDGFTIYKITSILFPLESPEAVSSVSVWKRYIDVQKLHKSMKSLHAGLYLRGKFPMLPRYNYFKRFQQEVIDDRAKTIKSLLEFIAEHRLLFTSTDFVNFLQTGYPNPIPRPSGVIDAIRTSLHLPIEETPPLEYQADNEDSNSPRDTTVPDRPQTSIDETDFISQIPIYEAADVEIRESPKDNSNSFESISSIESIDSDLFDELNKLTIDKSKPSIRKMLPDLINFDVPSTSNTIPRTKVSETSSVNSLEASSMCELERDSSMSVYSKSVLSLSNVENKTRTEDSYVFEAGYMLNLATRCEDMGDFNRAFECYKSGIEKMLIGVQTDSDPQRRALIKEKTNKYLSYAEEIYKKHLSDAEQSLLPEQDDNIRSLHCPIPISMLKRPYEDLGLYSVLAILGSSIMLVMHKVDKNCYAMKVLQKIPHNLTEFDEFIQRTGETRTPVLPTIIPYMVPLHAYIETNNLIFLILSYAPGEKLFKYIKNYAKSIPNTPARELNLENVFAEPRNKIDSQNNVENIVGGDNGTVGRDNGIVGRDNGIVGQDNGIVGRDNGIVGNDNGVYELVLNSQKLLLNVDKVLTEKDNVVLDNEIVETPCVDKISPIHPRDVLPPSAVCKWGAEILTALESLHNSGVICRDLNPSNILLGDRGQIILTYFLSYHDVDVTLSRVRTKPNGLYTAPELYHMLKVDNERVCDYWSYGVVMYELICGVPLSYYHRTMFTTHTILELPEGIPVEAESLLTQLLTYEPSERLGAGSDGVAEIKNHPYFKSIDWQAVYDSWIVPD